MDQTNSAPARARLCWLAGAAAAVLALILLPAATVGPMYLGLSTNGVPAGNPTRFNLTNGPTVAMAGSVATIDYAAVGSGAASTNLVNLRVTHRAQFSNGLVTAAAAVPDSGIWLVTNSLITPTNYTGPSFSIRHANPSGAELFTANYLSAAGSYISNHVPVGVNGQLRVNGAIIGDSTVTASGNVGSTASLEAGGWVFQTGNAGTGSNVFRARNSYFEGRAHTDSLSVSNALLLPQLAGAVGQITATNGVRQFFNVGVSTNLQVVGGSSNLAPFEVVFLQNSAGAHTITLTGVLDLNSTNQASLLSLSTNANAIIGVVISFENGRTNGCVSFTRGSHNLNQIEGLTPTGNDGKAIIASGGGFALSTVGSATNYANDIWGTNFNRNPVQWSWTRASSGGNTLTSLGETLSGSGTATAESPTATKRAHVKYTSATGPASSGVASAANNIHNGMNFEDCWIFEVDAPTTTNRIFIGYATGGNGDQTGTNANSFGLSFDSIRGDANWQFLMDVGGTATLVPTSISMASTTNTICTLFSRRVGTTISVWLNGTQIATNLTWNPAAATIRAQALNRALDNTLASQLDIYDHETKVYE